MAMTWRALPLYYSSNISRSKASKSNACSSKCKSSISCSKTNKSNARSRKCKSSLLKDKAS